MSHLLLSTAAMRRRLVGVVGSSGGGFIRNMNAMILVRGGSCCSSDITVRSPRHRKLVVDFQDKPLFGRRPLLFSSASATSSTSAEPPLEEDVASESLLDKYYIGKVKFFDRKKGYGYIQPGGNAKKHGEMEGYKNALLLKGQDIYVHASAFMHSNFLEGDQIPHLNRKDHVRFRIEANTQSKKLEPNRNHDTNTEKKNEANDEGGDDQSTNNGSNAGGSDENFALPPVQWRAVNVTFANGEPIPAYREQYLEYTVNRELQRLATEVIHILSQSSKEGGEKEEVEKSNSKEIVDTVNKLVSDAEILSQIRKAVAQSKEFMAGAFERRERHRRFAEEYRSSAENKRNDEAHGDNDKSSHNG